MATATCPDNETALAIGSDSSTSPDAAGAACLWTRRWDERRLFAVLCGAALLLAALSTVARLTLDRIEPGSYRGLAEILLRFDMDREHNIPTWYSTQLLFGCSLALLLIGLSRRRRRAADGWQWLALAAVFCYLSLDEAANLHEILIVPLRRRLDLHGMFYFAWVLPGFVIVAVLGLTFLKFVWRLEAVTRRRFIVAGGIYLAGALGLELVGGACAEAYGFDSYRYLAAMTLEETLEMLGASLFLCALLQVLSSQSARMDPALSPLARI